MKQPYQKYYSGFQQEEMGSSADIFLYGFNTLNLGDFFLCNDNFPTLTSILDSKEVSYN